MSTPTPRAPSLKHTTSLPYRFFGRGGELDLLDGAFAGDEVSLLALVGPGGQGKTAIVQHWLTPFLDGRRSADGVFLWSFYRGKDADLFLRELYAYAEGLESVPEVSASYVVDHFLPLLRRERWVLVLDGAEVVQHDSGPWFGRFIHPELGRFLEELATEPVPGLVLLTTRFPLPELERRRHARLVNLTQLDPASAVGLLRSLGLQGSEAELLQVAEAGCRHAKAVELLGTYLTRYADGQASRCHDVLPADAAHDEEACVLRVLRAHVESLPVEMRDLVALATAFREPPSEARFLDYVLSEPVVQLLQSTWGRNYRARSRERLQEEVQALVELRLLERVAAGSEIVLDAHPLVRRGFEESLGPTGRRESAGARAGFLHGRPDRRRPESLEEAREEIELFHAYCEASLWTEADGVLVGLDNPKHRFLAPALERDLLLRFFPNGDWRQRPLWPGFGRFRSLAISLELLGQFEEAIEVYRGPDAALAGDALIALGRVEEIIAKPQAAAPWQTLWQAYRAHALCLAGRVEEAVALARSLVPVDIYEWIHVFECLLRAGALHQLDLRSVLYRPPGSNESRWSELARRRMQADYERTQSNLTDEAANSLKGRYEALIEEYDRGGLPWERALTRLRLAELLASRGGVAAAERVARTALDLARRRRMRIIEADALALIT